MNGAVYISFFQGQLESVLEQVVQLAVQEISKSVGSSLNALLLETAAKEQENRQLRLQLQTREGRGSTSAKDGGSTAVGRSSKAGDERGDGGRTKPEPRGVGARSSEPIAPVDTRRLEQRGRVVGELLMHNTQTHVNKPTAVRDPSEPGQALRKRVKSVNRLRTHGGLQGVGPGSPASPVILSGTDQPQRTGSRVRPPAEQLGVKLLIERMWPSFPEATCLNVIPDRFPVTEQVLRQEGQFTNKEPGGLKISSRASDPPSCSL
ncbi:hypothetical protein XENORESO_009516 [Xenotaenia resolanae]|uniref:Uncharacterized protein n=1 Tax=Xenotaenia resolanae TaxID=208358 RepID=A0ABV0X1R5_9TELE